VLELERRSQGVTDEEQTKEASSASLTNGNRIWGPKNSRDLKRKGIRILSTKRVKALTVDVKLGKRRRRESKIIVRTGKEDK